MPSGTRDEEKPDTGSRQRKKALKHPVREAMLAELDERAMELAELATILGKPLALVEYHYRVLEAVGGIPEEESS